MVRKLAGIAFTAALGGTVEWRQPPLHCGTRSGFRSVGLGNTLYAVWRPAIRTPILFRMEAPKSGRMRILLADDFEVVRNGLKNLLSESGEWDICGEADNGLSAVQKTVELKPDVVVLDITMPVMNGLEAAREIRRLAPRTKIVMFSMHDSAHIAQEAKQAGADAYVAKSSGIEDIERIIAELLG